MTFSPVLAIKILKKLLDFPDELEGICAADFGIDSTDFGVQLDRMRHSDIIASMDRYQPMSYADAIKSNNTKVRITITDEGKKYWKDQSTSK